MLLERPNAIKEILHGSITARLIDQGFLGGPPHTHEISPKINFDKREIICILYFFLDQIGELLKEKFDNAHEVQQKKKRGRRMLLSR